MRIIGDGLTSNFACPLTMFHGVFKAISRSKVEESTPNGQEEEEKMKRRSQRRVQQFNWKHGWQRSEQSMEEHLKQWQQSLSSSQHGGSTGGQ